MHVRILMGVGAWLLGVAAATGGSLLAVSLLGQGIADSTGQQLTSAAVNRALASEAAEATARPPAPAPSVTRPGRTRPPAIAPPQPGAVPSARPDEPRPAPSPSAQAADGADTVPTSTVLTSPGGIVLADCRPAGAYLVSWSPTQGYEAGAVVRGPAATARVTFESGASAVTMAVSCAGGVPTATTVSGGSDDGGGGGGSGGGDE